MLRHFPREVREPPDTRCHRRREHAIDPIPLPDPPTSVRSAYAQNLARLCTNPRADVATRLQNVENRAARV